MSAPRKSKPARIADEIEANGRGWTVERSKSGNQRMVTARRGTEYVLMRWVRDETGRDVFAPPGVHDGVGVERDVFTNVAKKLREMAAPPDVPFALDDEDAVILEAVGGREVHWTSSMSGLPDSDVVPRGGVHLRLNQQADGNRVLTFAGSSGFRSVRLDRITKVS